MVQRGTGPARGVGYRAFRLFSAYYDLSLQLKEHFGARDPFDLMLLVLVAIGDLGAAPMDAELLAEKLDASRSTVERRIKAYIDSGVIRKVRHGKMAVYVLSDRAAADGSSAQPDVTADMIRTVMAMILDVANDT